MLLPLSVTVTCRLWTLSPLASPGASKSGAALKLRAPFSALIEKRPASAPPEIAKVAPALSSLAITAPALVWFSTAVKAAPLVIMGVSSTSVIWIVTDWVAERPPSSVACTVTAKILSPFASDGFSKSAPPGIPRTPVEPLIVTASASGPPAMEKVTAVRSVAVTGVKFNPPSSVSPTDMEGLLLKTGAFSVSSLPCNSNAPRSATPPLLAPARSVRAKPRASVPPVAAASSAGLDASAFSATVSTGPPLSASSPAKISPAAP